jgi:8-oxo-dGTP pyrophosphatase MutT (NUDIX family)
LANPWAGYKFQVDYQLIGDFFQSARREYFEEARVEQSLKLSRDWALRLRWDWDQGSATYQEGLFSVLAYF